MATKFDAVPKDYSQHGVFNVTFGEKLPVLEVELNELQNNLKKQLADEVNKGRFSGIREYLRENDSGFVNGFYLNNNATHNTNRVPMATMDATLKGFKLDIKGNIGFSSRHDRWDNQTSYINFSTPPTSGTRTDLAFVEAWFKEIKAGDPIYTYGNVNLGAVENLPMDSRINMETSRRIQLQWRIRVVDNASEVAGVNATTVAGTTSYSFSKDKEDKGLFVAGNGSATAKTDLGSTDGYVYGLPLFSVDRRNNGGYSVNNGNGARDYHTITFSLTSNLNVGETRTIKIDNNFSQMKVNDKYTVSNRILEVKALDSVNLTADLFLKEGGYMGTGTHSPWLVSDRPDGLYANLIDKRDVTDQRHYVPSSIDYNKILNEEFNRYMRGENGRKQLLKTYHGLPKTPIDSNHILNVSFDGTVVPEKGTSATSGGVSGYKPAITGLGGYFNGGSGQEIVYPISTTGTVITVDHFLYSEKVNSHIWGIFDTGGAFRFWTHHLSDGRLSLNVRDGNGQNSRSISTTDAISTNKWYHVRSVISDTSIKMYLDGKLVGETSAILDVSALTTEVRVGDVAGGNLKGNISDFSVSIIDRGATFATIPQDVTDGYAEIMPSFIGQRRILSDAQTSQLTKDVVPASGTPPYHITKTQATAGVWAINDTIKIKGLGGGAISGVIDTDTALANVTKDASGTSPLTISVDTVTGFAVNDKFRFYDTINGVISSLEYNVDSIDATAKTLTISFNSTSSISVGTHHAIIETTASSSVPLVTSAGIAGTWSGLASNEATYTITTAPTDTADSIKIDYSVNYPTGQGALSEVLDTTLQAEADGKKLVKGTKAITDDYKGKVAGSLTANPHIFYRGNNAGLLAPSSTSWVEEGTTAYDEISLHNGVSYLHQTLTSTEQAQVRMEIDVIRLFEDKYGSEYFNDCKTLQNKVDKIKNTAQILYTWDGYGSGPSGNYVELRLWRLDMSSWVYTRSHSSASPQEINQDNNPFDITLYIDNNGKFNALAIAEASDGVTASKVFTDYTFVDIFLKNKSGYDLLVPENPRRDSGKTNALYVRKETNEVEILSPRDEDGKIVTYGEYVPPANLIGSTTVVHILAEGDGFFVSDLSTSVGHKQGIHHYKNPLYRVRNNPVTTFGEFGFGNSPFASDSKQANVGYKVTFAHFGFTGYYINQYNIPAIKKPLVGIARFLVLHDGELKLALISNYTKDGLLQLGWHTRGTAMLIPISGRPLVKELENELAPSAVNAKDWRTPSGEIQGYLDENGNLVATYQ